MVAALLVSAVPAEAAWKYYACPSDNFASQFPDVPKMENVRFSMPRHKLALSARSYTATVDNMVYRMLVADYSDRVADAASILEEAIFQHTEADDHGLRNGKMVGNDSARIEPVVRGATYGRRITMDIPNNGGRNLTTFYFRGGKLYEQSVTILPASGDYSCFGLLTHELPPDWFVVHTDSDDWRLLADCIRRFGQRLYFDRNVSAFRVSLLHLTLIGGSAVITFTVATRVVFEHSGNLEKLEARNWWLLVALGLMLFGMATRISGDFWPKIMASHCIYGAVIWIAGVLLWSSYVLPKIWQVEAE